MHQRIGAGSPKGAFSRRGVLRARSASGWRAVRSGCENVGCRVERCCICPQGSLDALGCRRKTFSREASQGWDGSRNISQSDRAPQPRRTADRLAVRSRLPVDRGRTRQCEEPLRHLYRRWRDQDPTSPRCHRATAALFQSGEHSVPRARAPALLQPRRSVPSLQHGTAGVRSRARYLPSRSSAFGFRRRAAGRVATAGSDSRGQAQTG